MIFSTYGRWLDLIVSPLLVNWKDSRFAQVLKSDHAHPRDKGGPNYEATASLMERNKLVLYTHHMPSKFNIDNLVKSQVLRLLLVDPKKQVEKGIVNQNYNYDSWQLPHRFWFHEIPCDPNKEGKASLFFRELLLLRTNSIRCGASW